MNTVDFQKFWSALNTLNVLGCDTVIFKKSDEEKIRQAIIDHYGECYDQVCLRNIKIIFI